MRLGGLEAEEGMNGQATGMRPYVDLPLNVSLGYREDSIVNE